MFGQFNCSDELTIELKPAKPKQVQNIKSLAIF